MDKQYTGLQKALRTVGSVAKFASVVGVTQKVVNTWLKEDGCDAPPETRPENSGVRRAVEKAGSQAELARALGVSYQSIQIWLNQGYVPLARAQEIEMQFGIPRAELVSPKVRNAMGAGGGEL